MFVIETPGDADALTDGVELGPRPAKAQVVGTVEFKSDTEYKSLKAWCGDRAKHLIKQGSAAYDWTGRGVMYAWHVGSTQCFREPVPAGSKTQIGFSVLAPCIH